MLHCLNHSMQIPRTGCSTAAAVWGFPGGQRCPSVRLQLPGGAQALRWVPAQGRWCLGDSLTCSQGSHYTGQVGQCPAQRGHVQGHSQGHSQVSGQRDGGFPLLLSLWDCSHAQPTWAAPPVSCPRPSSRIRVGVGVTFMVVAPAGGGQGVTRSRHLPRAVAPQSSTTGPDPALLGTVGLSSAQCPHVQHQAPATSG